MDQHNSLSSPTNGGSMQKVLEVEANPEHKTVKCAIIWCYDPRFYESLDLFVKRYLGLVYGEFDPILGAGGAKGIGNPEDEHEKPYLLKQLLISITKHHARTIYLGMHADCAMFGNPKFPNAAEQQEFFSRELRLAKEEVLRFLTKNNLEAEVITVLATFDGIYREIV